MTNTENAQRRAEIDARLEAATPGEWEAVEDGDCPNHIRIYAEGVLVEVFEDENDAMFVVNAKQDIAWLRERNKALEMEVGGLLGINAHNSQLAEGLIERVKDLEAERDALLRMLDVREKAALNRAIAAERKLDIARKWAKWWKGLARQKYGHEKYYMGRLLHYKEQLEGKDNRIAALENAARSCRTCVFFSPDHEPHESDCCHSKEKCVGWVFAEKRFTKKGGAGE